MAFTLLTLIALAGAAFLGFLTAWYARQQSIDVALREKKESLDKLAATQAKMIQLESEFHTTHTAMETLQKQNRETETEVVRLQAELRVLEGELQVKEREQKNLQSEIAQLNDDLRNNIHEISVVREIHPQETTDSHLSTAEQQEMEKRIENAKRLVNAFKKGVGENLNASA